MPNVVKITSESPDEILNVGAYGAGALIRVQSSATEGGAYADLSGTGATPTVSVVSGTRLYTAYDPAGAAATWYRTRYENAGASRVSDWSASFQVGDETAGLLCSLYDVQQEIGTTTANDDELILEKIRQVSVAIEGYCDRWFAPRPTNPADTATFRFTSLYGSVLFVNKGVRAITTLRVADDDQPDVGGVFLTADPSSYTIQPSAAQRNPGWPGTRVVFLRNAPGPADRYIAAMNGAEITGSFGFAAVPADIQGIATRAVVRRFIGKGGGGAAVAIGPAGTEFLLPDMSGADRSTLDAYRAWPVG